MTTYGVTPAGFVTKPVQAIIASITQSILNKIAPDLDVSPDQPLGQLIGILANELASGGWEIGQVAYNATNRGDAEGDLLDNIGGLTGSTRLPPTPSSVPCTLVFSAAGTYAAGSLLAYVAAVPSQQWQNEADVTVPATSNDPSAPPNTPVSFAHPYTFGGSSSAPAVAFESTVDGPTYGDALVAANTILGSSGALDTTVPVAGWVSVADDGNVTIGTLEEQDAPYRLRQLQELAAPGSGTLDALGAKILQALSAVNNVLTGGTGVAGAVVEMYENTGLTTDANGLPAKSFEAVIYDGNPSGGQLTTNDQVIAGAIWTNKPAGMQDFGSHMVTYFDVLGIPRSVSFTRSTAVPIYLSFTVAVTATILANSALKTQLAQAITTALINATQGQPYTFKGQTITPVSGDPATFTPGSDVIANALRTVVQGQTGVLDVPAASFFLGTAFPATGTGNLGPFTIAQNPTLSSGNDGGGHAFITITFAALSPTPP